MLTLAPTPYIHTQSGLHVNDLFADLSDGRLLIRLLEIISGERIGSIGRGRLRINKIENVGKALHFLQEKKVSLPYSHGILRTVLHMYQAFSVLTYNC